MKRAGRVFHSDCPYDEIVGYGPNVRAVFTAFLRSDSHRPILLGNYSHFGVGASLGKTDWIVVQFR